MSTARQAILDRISQALADREPGPVIPRDYRGAGGTEPAGATALLRRFADRVTDYRVIVRLSASDQVGSQIATILAGRGLSRIVTPPGLPAEWSAPIPARIGDQPELTPDELDQVDGVLTCCRVAIAETGTIVLDHGPGQGRRALTLVPDYHLVVVRQEQIVPSVPDAVARLDPRRPMTWISGPSATSDIELSRVEGVHGPRRLDVLVLAES